MTKSSIYLKFLSLLKGSLESLLVSQASTWALEENSILSYRNLKLILMVFFFLIINKLLNNVQVKTEWMLYKRESTNKVLYTDC